MSWASSQTLGAQFGVCSVSDSLPPPPGLLSGHPVPTVWRPAPPHHRDHQRPRHVRAQALRQGQPREGECHPSTSNRDGMFVSLLLCLCNSRVDFPLLSCWRPPTSWKTWVWTAWTRWRSSWPWRTSSVSQCSSCSLRKLSWNSTNWRFRPELWKLASKTEDVTTDS